MKTKKKTTQQAQTNNLGIPDNMGANSQMRSKADSSLTDAGATSNIRLGEP